jgi:ketosteroid isomerase-like protein
VSDERERRLRDAIDAWNRRDFDAATAHLAADVEWDLRATEGPGVDVWRGHAGVREVWATWLAGFHDIQMDLERFVAREDRALIVLRQHGSGTASGVPVDFRFAQILTYAPDGLVTRVDTHLDVDAAARVAGVDA